MTPLGMHLLLVLSNKSNPHRGGVYRKRSAELKARLCNRGYKAQSVQKAVSEVGAKDRANLLEYKTKSIISRVHLTAVARKGP